MKKVISLFLSFVMLLSITAGLDFSAFAKTSGDYEYELLNDGTAEITNYNGTGCKITIPSKIGKYKVTRIGDYAFSYFDSLEKVKIPNSVTKIGSGAFSRCSNLEK